MDKPTTRQTGPHSESVYRPCGFSLSFSTNNTYYFYFFLQILFRWRHRPSILYCCAMSRERSVFSVVVTSQNYTIRRDESPTTRHSIAVPRRVIVTSRACRSLIWTGDFRCAAIPVQPYAHRQFSDSLELRKQNLPYTHPGRLFRLPFETRSCPVWTQWLWNRKNTLRHPNGSRNWRTSTNEWVYGNLRVFVMFIVFRVLPLMAPKKNFLCQKKTFFWEGVVRS